MRLIDTLDVTWYFAPIGLWCVAEISLAIIACCLPTMPKFFQVSQDRLTRISGRLSGSSTTKTATTAPTVLSSAKSEPLSPRNLEDGPYLGGQPTPNLAAGTWYREGDSDPDEQKVPRAAVRALPGRPLPVAYRHPDEPDAISPASASEHQHNSMPAMSQVSDSSYSAQQGWQRVQPGFHLPPSLTSSQRSGHR